MSVADCEAVMVAEPAPVIVTVLPEIVATEVLLLTKEKVPLLGEVGSVKMNGASPKVLVIADIVANWKGVKVTSGP